MDEKEVHPEGEGPMSPTTPVDDDANQKNRAPLKKHVASESDEDPDEADEDDKKRKTFPWKEAILVLIVVLAFFVKLPTVEHEDYMEEIPINLTMVAIESRSRQVMDCGPRNFTWSYRWNGWDPEVAGRISPRFMLTNMENLSGFFDVQFAFFDDKVYRFEDYSTKEVETVPWGAAAMSSERVRVQIEANSTALVTIPTEKRIQNAVYWTYADVVPPQKQACNPRLVNENVTVLRNFTKYVTRNASRCSVSYEFWWHKFFWIG